MSVIDRLEVRLDDAASYEHMFPMRSDATSQAFRRRRYDHDQGAVAELDNAPVSKTGDSRFESWLPRFSTRDLSTARRGMIRPWGSPPTCSSSSPASASATPRPRAGSGCRCCSRSRSRSARSSIHGLDGAMIVRLIIALIVTAPGVFVGHDDRGPRGERERPPPLRLGAPRAPVRFSSGPRPGGDRSGHSRERQRAHRRRGARAHAHPRALPRDRRGHPLPVPPPLRRAGRVGGRPLRRQRGQGPRRQDGRRAERDVPPSRRALQQARGRREPASR